MKLTLLATRCGLILSTAALAGCARKSHGQTVAVPVKAMESAQTLFDAGRFAKAEQLYSAAALR